MDCIKVLAATAAVLAMVAIAGCGKPRVGDADTGGQVISQTPSEPPLWVDSTGPWIEEWQDDNPEAADRYVWMVGTSEPVESIKFERWANESAREDAIGGLVAALGITVDSLGMSSENWSNESRDLVIGAYKEALMTQMARHDVNLSPYLWYGYEVEVDGLGGYKEQSYIRKGLFRLDKVRLNQGLIDDTAKEFAENVKERVKKNTEVQKELVDRAKEVTRQRMQELMGGTSGGEKTE